MHDERWTLAGQQQDMKSMGKCKKDVTPVH